MYLDKGHSFSRTHEGEGGQVEAYVCILAFCINLAFNGALYCITMMNFEAVR